MKISAVVLTKNEENNIVDCLETLQWCDEIIIIDDLSEDRTVQIAKKYTKNIYSRALANNFATQRNFGLEKAKGDFVLFVDADERISDALASEIKQKTENITSNTAGYFIKRLDSMWGRILQHGEQGNVKLLRLAQRNAGKWSGEVHEVWNIKGETNTFANPLLHYPHQTLTQFLTEINFYTTIRAQELFHKGEKSSWVSILVYTKAKFLQDYVLKMGFLDGMEGFVVALIMSMHSFLVRSKLWQLTEKK